MRARTLALADRIVDASNRQEPVNMHFPGDDLFAPFRRRRGLPIGNLTSQRGVICVMWTISRCFMTIRRSWRRGGTGSRGSSKAGGCGCIPARHGLRRPARVVPPGVV